MSAPSSMGRCRQGRRQGCVDHQRQAVFVRDRRDAGDVEQGQAGVADRFAEQQGGPCRDGPAPGIGVARVDEGGGDAEARQGIAEQVVRAAVERTRGDDVPARAGEGGDGQQQRRLAAGHGDRPTPPSSAAMRSSSTALVGLEMRE